MLAVWTSGCGGGSEPVQAGAEAEPGPSSAPGPEPGASTEVAPGADPTSPLDEAASTTQAAEPPPADGPSSVEGLSAAELQAVVEAPGPATGARRQAGPLADQVAVGGRTVWRITIPGTYDLLSSQIVVSVGGRDVGTGVVSSDLATLVAVTTDPALVVPGAAVTHRWGAGAPVDSGPLEVVR